MLARAAKPAQWLNVKEALASSRRWYEQGEGAAGDARVDPYAALNKLAIDAILGSFAGDTKQTTSAIELTRRCAEMARSRFASSGNFFDALTPADALLIEKLIDGSLVQSEKKCSMHISRPPRRSRPVPATPTVAGSYEPLRYLALRSDAEQDEGQKKRQLFCNESPMRNRRHLRGARAPRVPLKTALRLRVRRAAWPRRSAARKSATRRSKTA